MHLLENYIREPRIAKVIYKRGESIIRVQQVEPISQLLYDFNIRGSDDIAAFADDLVVWEIGINETKNM